MHFSHIGNSRRAKRVGYHSHEDMEVLRLGALEHIRSMPAILIFITPQVANRPFGAVRCLLIKRLRVSKSALRDT